MEGPDGRPARSRPRPSPRATARRSRTATSVLAHLWIGNGFSQEQAFSTYDEKQAELLTVNDQLPAFLAGIKDAKVGSRIAVTASAEEAFGAAGNAQLGIGNKDTVLVIVDLVSKVLDEPEGERAAGPRLDAGPEVQEGRAHRVRLRRARPSRPTTCAGVQLIKGTGPRVKKGQTIAVRYLGQVFGGEKPFDENFSDRQGAPTTFGIGTGAGHQGLGPGPRRRARSAPGWCSSIPPELGYGEEGNPDAGIQGHRHAGLRDRHPRRGLSRRRVAMIRSR